MEAFLLVALAAAITWFILMRRKETSRKGIISIQKKKSDFFDSSLNSNFSLSARQFDKVTSIYNTFSEVYPATLEEIILVFKAAPDIELEIVFWLKMRASYLEFLEEKNISEIPKKKEVFQILINCSKMPFELLMQKVKAKHINQNEIKGIIKNFTARLNQKWSL